MNTDDEKGYVFKYGMAIAWVFIGTIVAYLGGCIPQVGP